MKSVYHVYVGGYAEGGLEYTLIRSNKIEAEFGYSESLLTSKLGYSVEETVRKTATYNPKIPDDSTKMVEVYVYPNYLVKQFDAYYGNTYTGTGLAYRVNGMTFKRVLLSSI